MFSIEVTEKGLVSFTTRSKQKGPAFVPGLDARHPDRPDELRYWSRRGAKVRDRFAPGAFSRYGFKDRTIRYQERQKKTMGFVAPYRSPRAPRSYAALARIATTAATGGTISPAALANAARQAYRSPISMMKRVQQPGGYGVQSNGKRRIKTTLRWPGARILNRIRKSGDAAIYRKQFADLLLGGGRDATSILSVAQKEYTKRLAGIFQAMPRRVVGRRAA